MRGGIRGGEKGDEKGDERGGAKDGKDVQIRALEEQLVTSSKEFANEMSELKMKLFEFEMASGGGDSSDDDSDGGEVAIV